MAEGPPRRMQQMLVLSRSSSAICFASLIDRELGADVSCRPRPSPRSGQHLPRGCDRRDPAELARPVRFILILAAQVALVATVAYLGALESRRARTATS